ncbi:MULTISPECIES: DUF3955 domain-containing protein [Listeria]|uniref:DUF3955 domain-containing protein n=1 Tax=Listeria TaxID=1637 RepID=UPI000B588DBD|nr:MULTISPECIES: DUF3955 domain-containing protein [Listeria]
MNTVFKYSGPAFIVLGFISFVVSMIAGVTVGADGIVHEPGLAYVATGLFSIYLGIFLIIVYWIVKLVKKRSNKNAN